MFIAHLGPTDGVWDDASTLKVSLSGVAPGTARKKWLVPQRRVKVPGVQGFPERAMTIWEEIAWRLVGRKDVALWAETGPR
eukprot:8048871-Alexandrium_andersonii.AAC.1